MALSPSWSSNGDKSFKWWMGVDGWRSSPGVSPKASCQIQSSRPCADPSFRLTGMKEEKDTSQTPLDDGCASSSMKPPKWAVCHQCSVTRPHCISTRWRSLSPGRATTTGTVVHKRHTNCGIDFRSTIKKAINHTHGKSDGKCGYWILPSESRNEAVKYDNLCNDESRLRILQQNFEIWTLPSSTYVILKYR